jgi:hypothetical protein
MSTTKAETSKKITKRNQAKKKTNKVKKLSHKCYFFPPESSQVVLDLLNRNRVLSKKVNQIKEELDSAMEHGQEILNAAHTLKAKAAKFEEENKKLTERIRFLESK